MSQSGSHIRHGALGRFGAAHLPGPSPLFLAAGLLSLLMTQVSFAQQSPQGGGLGARAANAWMRTPTDVSAPTDVPSDLRRRRDLYFDSVAAVINIREPLTPEKAGMLGLSEGSRIAGGPEIRPGDLRSIVIGRFESSRSVFSASQKAIYTEIKFAVTDMYEDASGRANPGADITLAFLGGTVRTRGGKTISLLANERRYALQPGRTYLLVLEYHPEQEMYLVVSNWDFTTGVVTANSSADRELEMRGESRIIGLTKEQLDGYFKELLKNQR